MPATVTIDGRVGLVRMDWPDRRNALGPQQTRELTSALVEAGGLLSYGADTTAQYKRLASIADRILRGGKVGEIPVERPTVFILSVNLKTARALRVSIPRQVLSRAGRVIQ